MTCATKAKKEFRDSTIMALLAEEEGQKPKPKESNMDSKLKIGSGSGDVDLDEFGLGDDGDTTYQGGDQNSALDEFGLGDDPPHSSSSGAPDLYVPQEYHSNNFRTEDSYSNSRTGQFKDYTIDFSNDKPTNKPESTSQFYDNDFSSFAEENSNYDGQYQDLSTFGTNPAPSTDDYADLSYMSNDVSKQNDFQSSARKAVTRTENFGNSIDFSNLGDLGDFDDLDLPPW